MHAAVVTDFAAPPQYREHPDPVAEGPHEAVVDVLAAPLHRLARARAAGLHYTTTTALPLVPGVDAVVRDQDGKLWYTIAFGRDVGTFAERTVIDRRLSVPLPDDADPVRIAAAMNPAMASWVALRQRISFQPGGRVLVLGATGVAGRMAVQIAKHLGASHVTAAGRNAARLAEVRALGADVTVTFDEVGKAADVDVALDFVWGEPAARSIRAVVASRTDRRAPLDWIHVGSVAGQELTLDAEWLRAIRLQVSGSGIGSVTPEEYLAELPGIAAAVHDGAIDVRARAVPLADVTETWNAAFDERLVFVP